MKLAAKVFQVTSERSRSQRDLMHFRGGVSEASFRRNTMRCTSGARIRGFVVYAGVWLRAIGREISAALWVHVTLEGLLFHTVDIAKIANAQNFTG